MKLKSSLSIFAALFLLIAGFTSTSNAESLEGRVYEGEYLTEPPTAQGLAGVSVKLYGSHSSGSLGDEVSSYTTGSDGWYSLETEQGYEYFTIECEGKSGYSFDGSSSVGGSASGEQIQYSVPLTGKTLTGNKFWYTSETTPPSNNPPVANDDSATTPQDTAVDIDVLYNDNDLDGDPLHINSATDPLHGTTVNHGTHVTYTPDPGFTGTDTFDYTAGDGKGGTNTATVTVTVEQGEEPGQNNPPVADAGGPYSTQVGNPVMLDGSGSYDPDTGDSITGYQWYWFSQGNYIPINGVLTTPTIWWVPPVAGQFTLKLEVTDSHGEIDTDTSTVNVQEDEPPTGKGTMDGYKWDADTQEGLEGWRIFIDINGNGEFDSGEPSDLTDSNGYYRIDEVEPGTYRVCEQMQEGWEPAGGDSACVEAIDVIAGTITTLDFNNRRTEGPAGGVILSGIKYNDLNDNGNKDPGEPGLPGWQITLEDGDHNLLATTTTDYDGTYSFTITELGIYIVNEVQQSGWRQTGPVWGGQPSVWWFQFSTLWEPYEELDYVNFGNHQTGTEPPEGTGSIRGMKYNDINGNGEKDIGESGLAGWTIFLDLNDNGNLDEGEPQATTDANGNYEFTELEAGVYRIHEVNQAGWLQTDPAVDGVPGYWLINLEEDHQETEIDFGNIQSPIPGSCGYFAMGTKYNDLNGDGQQDLGSEPGLTGWRIYQDLNENGRWDEGEPNDITDANGNYWLCIDQGDPTYEPPIREVLEDGWVQTEPGPPLYAHYNAEACRLIWPEGCYQLDFGNHQIGTEPPERTGSIMIIKDALQVSTVPFDFTGDLGPFTLKIGESKVFSQLPPGQYTVTESLPGGGWKMGTYQITGDFDGGTTSNQTAQSITIDLDAGEDIILIIYNYREEGPEPRTGSIHGVKFNDLNGNKQRDSGEPGLPNWEIQLWQDGAYKALIDSTMTDASGAYAFESIPEGEYDVHEISKSGWIQTYPGGMGYHTVTLSGGQVVTDLDFGNELQCPFGMVLATKINDANASTLPGWRIYQDLNDNGIWDEGEPNDITDANGRALICTVEVDGDYVYREVMQPGWVQIYPGPPSYAHRSSSPLSLIWPEGGYISFSNRREEAPEGGSGSVVVVKEATPADDTPFLFCADFSPGGFFDTLCQNLMDPSNNTWTINNPNLLQKISETVPAGWTLTDITITGDTDNGSNIDLANTTVDVDFDEGENIVITFKNLKTITGGYDYGDAPGPYPDASHELGGPRLGNNPPDADPGTQSIPPGEGDDNDADGDDEDGLLSINLVKTAGTWSTWEILVDRGLSSDAICGLWIDFNGDGDWDDPDEAQPLVRVGGCRDDYPLLKWIQYGRTFPLPNQAKVGTTYARLRVYNDCNATISPSGAGGPGEVEDFLVEIKADGPGVPPGGIVHGYKFNDLNNNKAWDANEPALPGWTIWLDANQNGIEDAGDQYVQTDTSGYFQFVGLASGQYLVGEVQQADWIQTAPTGGTHTVNVDPSTPSLAISFGNIQSGGPTFDGRICGSKWNDINGDGIPDATEPILAGWTIYLDMNKNNQWDTGEPSQLTDASGSYEFTGLAVGSYTLAEVMQQGWKQTWPGGTETHIISVPTGSIQPACVMFGNQRTSTGLPLDWGDAPDPNYPTLRASNGAYHVIVPGIFLGGGVDAEPDGLPSPDALGDDNNGSGDEDGVTFITPIIPGQSAEVEVIASSAGYLDAWIDFDADGSWSQASDQIFLSEAVQAGSNILNFHVPASIAVHIDTYARFRFSSAGGLSPDGAAQDGEVEDYHILLGENGPYVPGEVQVPHLKWSQPPIEIDPNTYVQPVFCGWNEPARSTEQSGSKRQWRMDADDFHCLGSIPITQIRWWGSYKAWTQSEPPELQPEIWHIGIWANQVEGITPGESYLERLVWSVEIPNERVHHAPAGHTEFPDEPGETCFVYEVQLEPEEWFHQAEFESNDDVFWIAITAVYPADVLQVNMWAWTTRPHVWGKGAVMPAIMGDWPTFDERLFPGRIYPIENSLLCGQNRAYDMCFELLTEEPWVKWDQPFTGIREWQNYSDDKSMAMEQDEGAISMLRRVADDWFCERQNPVTAIAWNGSYIGYGYEACKCEDITEPRKPDYFLLSIWDNATGTDAEGHHYPGEKIWEFKAENYDEVLVGYDQNPDGEPNEPVFRYSVRLPEDSWFRQEIPENIYWFSVIAVYKESEGNIPYEWGWTNHSHTFGNPAMSLDTETATILQWQPLLDSATQPVDMSFEFLTATELRPLAHWKFDETRGTTAIDSVGNHHGQVYSGTWTEGIIDGALNLNGLNGYIDCGNSNLLGPEHLTLAMWLHPAHMGGTRYIVSRGQKQSDNIDFAVTRWLDGEIEFILSQDGNNPLSVISQGQVPLNQWSHVAVTCSGDSASVYINGTLDASAIMMPRSPYDESQFVLGSLLGETRFFNGRIDEVILYDRAFPQEQITELAAVAQ